MNRKDVINKMMIAIANQEFGDDCGLKDLNDEQLGTFEGYAEAALDAFLGELEEPLDDFLDRGAEYLKVVDSVKSELYQEILDLKKGVDE